MISKVFAMPFWPRALRQIFPLQKNNWTKPKNSASNVNIAAVLSMAGIGFDRTRLEVVADPGLELNTHTIRVSGPTGRLTIVLENLPAPENPKTSWLACYSALAALRAIQSNVRYGT